MWWVCLVRLGPGPGEEAGGRGKDWLWQKPEVGAIGRFSVPFVLSASSPSKPHAGPLSPSAVMWWPCHKAVLVVSHGSRGSFPLWKLSDSVRPVPLQTQNPAPFLGSFLVFPSLPWKSPCYASGLTYIHMGPWASAQECPAETPISLSE